MIIIKLAMFLWITDGCNASDSKTQRVDDAEDIIWTPMLDAKLIEIFHKTDTGKDNHQGRMKELWDKKLPQYQALSSSYLHQRALILISGSSNTSQRYMEWKSQLESELIQMYRRLVKSNEKRLALKLHSEFYGKYPAKEPLLPETLWRKAQTLHDRSQPAGTLKLRHRVPWSGQHAEDALRIYHEYPANNRDQGQQLYEAWIKLHPEYREINPHSLQRQMRKLARLSGKEKNYLQRHKWTPENYADLLHIYHRVDREEVGYLQRVHERWGKINPELSYMDKEALRKRLKYLIDKNYEPTESEMEQARIKFDNLPPPEYLRKVQASTEARRKMRQNTRTVAELDILPPPKYKANFERRLRKLNKGKEKIDPPAEHSNSIAPRLHNPRPLQFYDFMSVNESHRESSHIPDEETQNSYVAGSSQTSYNTPTTFFNFMNLHHGESSTSKPTSHQHQNSTSNSPS